MIIGATNFQIIGGGGILALIYEEEGGEQHAYILTNPIMQRLEIRNDVIDVTGMDGSRDFMPGFISTEVTIIGGAPEFRTGTDLLFDLDFFQMKTVKELLQIVNRKLRERK